MVLVGVDDLLFFWYFGFEEMFKEIWGFFFGRLGFNWMLVGYGKCMWVLGFVCEYV